MAEYRALHPQDIPDWVLRNPAEYDPDNPLIGIEIFRHWRIARNRYLCGIGLAERLPDGGVRLGAEAAAIIEAERANRWPVTDPAFHYYREPTDLEGDDDNQENDE